MRRLGLVTLVLGLALPAPVALAAAEIADDPPRAERVLAP